jgi:hypothetical protein
MKKESNNCLNRFTKSTYALQMLKDEEILLPRPDNWIDKNDVIPLQYYRIAKQKMDLFALCFTHQRETAYHWYINNDLNSTCCIEFYKDKFEEIINGNNKKASRGKFLFNTINYKMISKIKKLNINDIPFIKRKPYENEAEYRVIWIGSENNPFKKIKITPNCIRKITVGSKAAKEKFISLIKEKSKTNKQWKSIIINVTTLEYNEKWIENIKGIISNDKGN